MSRNLKYLNDKRIVYRRDPINDKPTHDNEQYMYYSDGTQQKIRKMNKNEQQMYKDISDLTKAVQKLVKLIEKMAKSQL